MEQDISMEEFEGMVADEFERVPDRWKALMKNVALLVEEEAEESPDILGFYRGVPTTERGSEYGGMLPDTITLYYFPILRAAKEDGLPIRRVVKETLWHEIAHHFGFEEEEVYKRELEGSNDFRA